MFKIPRNIDNFQKKKQLNWFFNIYDSSVLGKSNYQFLGILYLFINNICGTVSADKDMNIKDK